MDEQTQAVAVRRRRNRAEAGQIVAEYEASGLSQVEFCRNQGLSLATLSRYRRRRSQGAAVPEPGNRWVAVEIANSCAAAPSRQSSGLTVALARGRRIEVGQGFDAATLLKLLGVLERF